MPWTPTAGSGFSSTASSTSNLVSHTYGNGATAQSWDLNMTWSAAADRLKQYTPTTSGCQNFTTGPSGKFAVTYTGVAGPTSLGNTSQYVRGEVLIVVTLSDGRVLNYRTQTTEIVA
ncbi:hypothetical protein VVR12_08165 [Rothia sp. LK2588]|uniref:hypothetical protein n=1 Tax=Rothia sp. LK2588 TaxID=3114369 RepID=UPI0034CD9543